MKTLLISLVTLFLAGPQTFANESLSEKAAETGRDIKRSTKKGWNRTKEAVCMEGDLECAGKKAKNRMGEGVDTVKDKTSDVKNSVDSNSDSND